MPTLEQVEQLRERMNVTYEEAKEALLACDDDMLDAIIYLEKKGKQAEGNAGGSYSTQQEQNQRQQQQQATYTYTQEDDRNSFGNLVKRFFIWCGKWIKRGNANVLEVVNNGQVVMTLPITVLILLLIFGFWFLIPTLIVGLFCGLRYRFRGQDVDGTRVNEYMDKASETADNIRSEVRSEPNDPYANGQPNDDGQQTQTEEE